MATIKVKRGRGRPTVFKGYLAAKIVNVVKEHGLSGGREYLATVGVQTKPFGPVKPVSISLPTLGKLAKAGGVELQRGRPKAA